MIHIHAKSIIDTFVIMTCLQVLKCEYNIHTSKFTCINIRYKHACMYIHIFIPHMCFNHAYYVHVEKSHVYV